MAFLDETVAAGKAPSRASIIEAALEREIRRHIALRDVEILRNTEDYDEFDALARWAAQNFTMDD